MTWGELRKCRARTRSSERSGAGGGDDDDDDDASSDEELGGGVSVERGLDSDGAAGDCELSSLLAVIARLNGPSRFPVPSCGHGPSTEYAPRLHSNPPQVFLAHYLSLH
jgi:hypothetical protein